MNKQIAAQPGERACAGGLAVGPGCNLPGGVQVVDDLTSIELLCQEAFAAGGCPLLSTQAIATVASGDRSVPP